jgi:hypothetical protein
MMRISEEDDCPTEDFTPGIPEGKCWGDGHYKCDDCVFFRADFKADSTLRDRLLAGQRFIQISSII